jgi:hypothetical protein
VRHCRSRLEVALEVDGELPGKLPATFQIVPEALRVRSGSANWNYARQVPQTFLFACLSKTFMMV